MLVAGERSMVGFDGRIVRAQARYGWARGVGVSLRPVARLLLGSLAEAGLNDIRYVTLGSLPYVIYLVLRDYFDAISAFPMNTVALTIAIVIQAVLLSGRWTSVPVATACSFFALGLTMVLLWIGSVTRS